MNLTIRPESPADYRIVEELTREAFWKNTDRGVTIDEHLLVHKLRKSHIFVPDLDYVAETDGRIIGNVMYSKSKIVAEGKQDYEVLTFGPLSVLPEYQNQGVGKALMQFTITEAKKLGYTAIVFCGEPD
ncbi:MAG: N-acetyltransferase [Eubacteriales bacterium]|nr:N-acetyltransferase [Eubacteriales bacterium]